MLTTPHSIDSEALLATGRRVIGTEASALGQLAESLGPTFVEAIRRIQRMPRSRVARS